MLTYYIMDYNYKIQSILLRQAVAHLALPFQGDPLLPMIQEKR